MTTPVLKFEKQPRELLDFDVDMADLLALIEDDARSSDPIEAQAEHGITLFACYWVPETQCVKLWFADGQTSKTYRASFLFHTEGGRAYECDLRMKVKDY